ncbi:Odorant-binding protein 83a [Carabus blaptoides fortunei]
MLQFVFVLVVVCVSTQTTVNAEEYPPAELLEMLQPIHDYCAKEIGVSEDVLKNYDIDTKDHNVMCYMMCFMKQSNWMTMDGEIKFDFIVANPWEPIRHIIIANVNKCRDIEHDEDECVLVYNFAKCIHDVDEEHWFLP